MLPDQCHVFTGLTKWWQTGAAAPHLRCFTPSHTHCHTLTYRGMLWSEANVKRWRFHESWTLNLVAFSHHGIGMHDYEGTWHGIRSWNSCRTWKIQTINFHSFPLRFSPVATGYFYEKHENLSLLFAFDNLQHFPFFNYIPSNFGDTYPERRT